MQPNPFEYRPSSGGLGRTGAAVVPGLMTRVYQWMALGLAMTGATALAVSSQEQLIDLIFRTPLQWVLLLAMVGMGVALTGFVTRMSAAVAFTVFALYSVVVGAALAPIFLIYTGGSIASTFFVTGGTFLATSLFGHFTKRDLTGFGTFLSFALIGLVIATIVNMVMAAFFNGPSEVLYWVTTYAGVLIFAGLTAYDTQKIKHMAMEYGPNAPPQLAIQGATILYLDFVNLFLYLLRIFGRSRD